MLYGVPPMVTEWAGLVIGQFVVLTKLIWLQYRLRMEYLHHVHELSPAEQYRRTLRAGAWGAYL